METQTESECLLSAGAAGRRHGGRAETDPRTRSRWCAASAPEGRRPGVAAAEQSEDGVTLCENILETSLLALEDAAAVGAGSLLVDAPLLVLVVLLLAHILVVPGLEGEPAVVSLSWSLDTYGLPKYSSTRPLDTHTVKLNTVLAGS